MFDAKPNLGNVSLKFGVDIGSQETQYDRQVVSFKVTSLKISSLLSIATNNMHMKFENEIPMQTLVTLWTDRQTDRQTHRLMDGRKDGHTDKGTSLQLNHRH